MTETCDVETVENQVARVCHEANRAYCESLGDDSQPPWAKAPWWQRASAIAGVEACIADPDLTPEMSHESWLKQKRADGWVYGPEKDVEKKTHPCMVPYSELPPDQKRKDRLFTAIVKALLDSAATSADVLTPEEAKALLPIAGDVS